MLNAISTRTVRAVLIAGCFDGCEAPLRHGITGGLAESAVGGCHHRGLGNLAIRLNGKGHGDLAAFRCTLQAARIDGVYLRYQLQLVIFFLFDGGLCWCRRCGGLWRGSSIAEGSEADFAGGNGGSEDCCAWAVKLKLVQQMAA